MNLKAFIVVQSVLLIQLLFPLAAQAQATWGFSFDKASVVAGGNDTQTFRFTVPTSIGVDEVRFIINRVAHVENGSDYGGYFRIKDGVCSKPTTGLGNQHVTLLDNDCQVNDLGNGNTEFVVPFTVAQSFYGQDNNTVSGIWYVNGVAQASWTKLTQTNQGFDVQGARPASPPVALKSFHMEQSTVAPDGMEVQSLRFVLENATYVDDFRMFINHPWHTENTLVNNGYFTFDASGCHETTPSYNQNVTLLSANCERLVNFDGSVEYVFPFLVEPTYGEVMNNQVSVIWYELGATTSTWKKASSLGKGFHVASYELSTNTLNLTDFGSGLQGLDPSIVVISEEDFTKALNASTSTLHVDAAALAHAQDIAITTSEPSVLGINAVYQEPLGSASTVPFTGELFLVVRSPWLASSALDQNGDPIDIAQLEANSFYIAAVKLSGTALWLGHSPNMILDHSGDTPDLLCCDDTTAIQCNVLASQSASSILQSNNKTQFMHFLDDGSGLVEEQECNDCGSVTCDPFASETDPPTVTTSLTSGSTYVGPVASNVPVISEKVFLTLAEEGLISKLNNPSEEIKYEDLAVELSAQNVRGVRALYKDIAGGGTQGYAVNANFFIVVRNANVFEHTDASNVITKYLEAKQAYVVAGVISNGYVPWMGESPEMILMYGDYPAKGCCCGDPLEKERLCFDKGQVPLDRLKPIDPIDGPECDHFGQVQCLPPDAVRVNEDGMTGVVVDCFDDCAEVYCSPDMQCNSVPGIGDAECYEAYVPGGHCNQTNCDPVVDDQLWNLSYGSWVRADPGYDTLNQFGTLDPECAKMVFNPDSVPPQCQQTLSVERWRPNGIPQIGWKVLKRFQIIELCNGPDYTCSNNDSLLCDNNSSHCIFCDSANVCRPVAGPGVLGANQSVEVDCSEYYGIGSCGEEAISSQMVGGGTQGTDNTGAHAGNTKSTVKSVYQRSDKTKEKKIEPKPKEKKVVEAPKKEEETNEEEVRGEYSADVPERKEKEEPEQDGDPVVLASGDLVYNVTDLQQYDMAQLPVEFKRTYRSQGFEVVGHLGRNWEHGFEEKFILLNAHHVGIGPVWCYDSLPQTNCIYHMRGDGYSEIFLRNPKTGYFMPEAGVEAVIKVDEELYFSGTNRVYNTFTMRSSDGVMKRFSGDGRIRQVFDVAGNIVNYTYNEDGYLASVLNNRLHGLYFTYGGWGLLESVEDHVGRKVDFHYEIQHGVNDTIPFEPNAVDSHYETRVVDFGIQSALQLYNGGPINNPQGIRMLDLPQDISLEDKRTHGILRTMAFLKKVVITPSQTPHNYYHPGNNVSNIVYHYTYSEMPFNQDYKDSVENNISLQFDTGAIAPPSCFDTGSQEGSNYMANMHKAVALNRELNRYRGSLERVTRDINPHEFHTGNHVLPSQYNPVGGHFLPEQLILLETLYGWNINHKDSYGKVLQQRYGTDTNPSGPIPSYSGLNHDIYSGDITNNGPLYPDSTVSDMAVFSLAYYDDLNVANSLPSYVLGPNFAGSPPCEYLHIPLYQNDNISIHVYDDSNEDLFQAYLDGSWWDVDTLQNHYVGKLKHWEDLDGFREERRLKGLIPCSVVRVEDRAGNTTYNVLNMMGRSLREVVEKSDGTLVESSYEYNADGYPVRHVAPNGTETIWEYDESGNPFAFNNVTRVEVQPGDPSVGISFAGQHYDMPDGDDRLVWEYAYEPILNQVARVRKPGWDGLHSVAYFEYQESQGALDDAAQILSEFGVSANLVTDLGLHPGVGLDENTQQMQVDLNGDGSTSYARPYPVVMLETPHLIGTGSVGVHKTLVSYDGYGNVISVKEVAQDSTGNDIVGYEAVYGMSNLHDPLSDPSHNVCSYFVGGCSSPVHLPAGPDKSPGPMPEGGPWSIKTETFKQAVSSGEFGLATQQNLVTTRTFNAGGQVSGVVEPNGGAYLFQYDTMERNSLIINPEGLQQETFFDGDGRPARIVQSNTSSAPNIVLPVQQFFRDGEGRIIAICTELRPDTNTGACLNDLDVLIAGRDISFTTSPENRTPQEVDSITYHLQTFLRDGEGRVVESVSPAGRGVYRSYTATGQVKEEATFDARIANVNDRVLTRAFFSFDAYDRVSQVQVGVGNGTGDTLTTEYSYDSLGRVAGVLYPDGVQYLYTYNPRSSLMSQTRVGADGYIYGHQEVVRDINDNPLEHHVWLFEGPLATLDPMPPNVNVISTHYTYDEFGRVASIQQPDGVLITNGYASDHSLIAQHSNQGTQQFSYTQISAGANYSYTLDKYLDPANNNALVRKMRTVNTHDIMGRVVSSTQIAGLSGQEESRTVSKSYDIAGRMKTSVDESGTVTDYIYDTLSRLRFYHESRVAGQSGINDYTVAHLYDRDSLLVNLSDPEDRTSIWQYDGMGRKVLEVVPGTDATYQTITRTWDYDDLTRLEQYTEGNVRKVVQYYPNAAQPSTITGYDGLDPATGIVNGVQTFQYDLAGRVESAVNVNNQYSDSFEDVETVRDYNSLDQLIQEDTTIGYLQANPVTYTVTFEPDNIGRPYRVVAPSSFESVHAYDGVGRLGSISYDTGTNVTALTYGYEGVWSTGSTTNLNGQLWFDQDVQRDVFGRATSLDLSNSQSAILARHVRRYDKHDRVAVDWLGHADTQGSLVGRSWVPSYDGRSKVSGLDRAQNVAEPNDTQWANTQAGINWANTQSGDTFVYERSTIGTLTRETMNGTEQWSATQAMANAKPLGVSSVTHTAQSITQTLSWDASGRLEGQDTKSYQWGSNNLIQQVTEQVGATTNVIETRIYDAFGRAVRLVQKKNGIDYVIDRVFSGPSLMEEHTDCGRRSWMQSADLDAPVGYELEWDTQCAQTNGLSAEVFDVNDSLFTSSSVRIFGLWQDLHNNSAAVIDDGGVVVEKSVYDAFGVREVLDASLSVLCSDTATSKCSSSFGNITGYTGAILSGVTGLYEMRARFYEPALRQFVSPDPLGFIDEFDVWQYVAGDPINKWDPFGLAAEAQKPRDRERELSPAEQLMNGVGDRRLGLLHNEYEPPRDDTDYLSQIPDIMERQRERVFDAGQETAVMGAELFLSPELIALKMSVKIFKFGRGLAKIRQIAKKGRGILNQGKKPPGSSPGKAQAGDDIHVLPKANPTNTQVTGPTYEIGDGVRRSKAISEVLEAGRGNGMIKARVIMNDKVVETIDLHVSQLLSPHKSFIDTSGKGWDRWFDVLKGAFNGDEFPPIDVSPGSRGIPIKDVEVR